MIMFINKGLRVLVLVASLVVFFAIQSEAQQPLKIGVVQGFSGALEAYAKQMLTGFKMGLEYGTKGKNEVIGRKIELIVEDDQIKPDVAKRLITKLYADDKVDMVVGTTSSAAALAMLPVAQEFKKILLVEPAVADSITGSAWNRYVFRTGRNSRPGRHLQCQSSRQARRLSRRNCPRLCIRKRWSCRLQGSC